MKINWRENIQLKKNDKIDKFESSCNIRPYKAFVLQQRLITIYL